MTVVVSSGQTVTLDSENPYSQVIVENGGYALVEGGLYATEVDVQSGGRLGIYGSAGTVTLESGASADVDAAQTVIVQSAAILEVPIRADIQNLQVSGGAQIKLSDAGYDASDDGTYVLDPAGLAKLEGLVESGVDSDYYGQTTYDGLLSELAGDTVTYGLAPSDGEGSQVLLTVDDGTPCFCRGTLIATERDEINVEDLAIGDRVLTASGSLRPIRWIGHRSYSGPFVRSNRNVLPVIIRAGALGDGLPRRDLSVSPLHAMALEGVLIPAVCLINEVSILQAERIDEVTYFHIELETHDILLAEGAPSESFVDDDSRNMFHNAAEFRALYPDAAPLPAVYCAPRIEEGPILETIRARLNAEAGITPAPASGGIVEGYLDEVTRTVIRGWARHPQSEEPLRLSLYENGIAIGEVVADSPRPDVGTDCGFCFVVRGGLAPDARHVIEIGLAGDPGRPRNLLGHTPWVLDQQAAREPLIAQSAVPASSTTMRGYIDSASRDRICGWISDPAQPEESVAIQVVANGTIVERTIANGRRPDVADTGAGPERCGFDLLFVPPLSPLTRQIIEIRSERTGALLGQPIIVEAADQFDSDLEQAVRRATGSVQDAKGYDRALSFLAAQMERLKQSHADHQSGRRQNDVQRERSRRGLSLPAHRALRALVVDARMPDARRDAGSCAILSHMTALQALGYDVSFVAADEMGSASTQVMDDIDVCALPFYSSVEDLLRRQAQSFDLVYLHRQSIATRYLPLVRQYQPQARVIYAVADLHHMRIARQAAVEERPELMPRARQLRDAEYAVARQTDV
ncbi:hypothetical protein HKD24_14365, partial [Gluconobacter sp. LMG 31484]